MDRRIARAALGLGVALCPTGVVAAAVSPSAAPKPAIAAFSAKPARLPAGGGIITLTARVRNAATCTFGYGGTAVTVSCRTGHATVRDTVGANRTARARTFGLWLVARGHGIATPRRFVRVVQPKLVARAATHPSAPVNTLPPITGTTLPPTATTTPASATRCSGPCTFSFPGVDDSGFSTVTLNSVGQGSACPDAGFCDASADQQIDDVNVTMCAGSSGVSDASSELGAFALALTDNSQASQDSVSFDSSVPNAWGNYGAVAPGQCVTGDVYFDAPAGSAWSSLNFSYSAAASLSQAVYVWDA